MRFCALHEGRYQGIYILGEYPVLIGQVHLPADKPFHDSAFRSLQVIPDTAVCGSRKKASLPQGMPGCKQDAGGNQSAVPDKGSPGKFTVLFCSINAHGIIR